MSDPHDRPIPSWDGAVLAILAHDGADETVRQFMPKWKQVPSKLIGCYPRGDKAELFDRVLYAGESARTGEKVYRRFTETLRGLLNTPAKWYVLAEYDAVPLRPELPKMMPGKLTSSVVVDHDAFGIRGNKQYAFLPPWIFDRESAQAFLKAADYVLSVDPDPPRFGGLLDRWIAATTIVCRVPSHCFLDSCPFAPHRSIEWIEENDVNWIHGWKSKEEFGRLWKD